MCGKINFKYQCPKCYAGVSTRSENLTCAAAKYWGGCGSATRDNRDITKESDKLCTKCTSAILENMVRAAQDYLRRS
ncbi:hypothetical protein B0T20DRAFT_358008 [Sordaria brevicollis]|uniref:Uncharacterized protein n=1 Tax=Sordaria brevicollis TaxID=83679 RepID=A0AAE0PAV6_SORBR|nr:hypothetical protein B0T20DRAFT_358008 [Sordaria brevicollis]